MTYLWAQAESTRLVCLLSTYGFTSCTANPTVLIRKTQDGLVILAIYVDDFLLTGSDNTSLRALGSPRYFLGIDFAHQDGQLSLTHRKYP